MSFDTLNTDYEGQDPARSCTRKKAYPHEQAAKMSIRAILEMSPEADVRVYGCRHCGCWHVGGSPGSRREVLAEGEVRRRPDPGRPRRGAQGERHSSRRRSWGRTERRGEE